LLAQPICIAAPPAPVQIPEILKPVQAVVSGTNLSHNFPRPTHPGQWAAVGKNKVYRAPRNTARASTRNGEKSKIYQLRCRSRHSLEKKGVSVLPKSILISLGWPLLTTPFFCRSASLLTPSKGRYPLTAHDDYPRPIRFE
jgi:hypothetical protein